MSFTILLAGLAIILFFIYFFYNKGSRRSGYLQYVVLMMPLMDQGVTPAAFGGLSVFDLVSFLTFFLCFNDFIRVSGKNMGYLAAFFFLIALIFLSSLYSIAVSKSLFNILTIVSPFIYIRFLLKELKENDAFFQKIIQYLKIACLTGVAFVLIQIFVGVRFTFYDQLNQNVFENKSIRYPGFFMDSQMNGLFLAMMSFIFLVNLPKAQNPRNINYILFGIVAVCVMLAGSRSGLLGLAAGIGFLVVFVGGRFRPTVLIYSLIAAGLLLLFSDSFVIFQRFNSMDDSLSLRASIWDGAYDIFLKNFTLGIGINNYQDYVKLHSQDQYLVLENNEILFLDAPENGYLKLLTEFGFFAFFTLFMLILSPVINTFFKFMKGKKVVIGFFFIAPIICWLLTFSSFSSFNDSRIVIVLCSFLGFLIAYPSDPKPENE